jgi:hypothetical protein
LRDQVSIDFVNIEFMKRQSVVCESKIS